MSEANTSLIPAKPDKARLTKRIISSGSRDWASIANVMGNVTPAKLISIFRDADQGNPGAQVELAQDLRERDDHLFDVDQIRRAGVTGLEWIIEPGDESDQAQLAADAFRDAWEAIEPSTILDRMMDAVLEQWSIQEVIWDTDGKIEGKRFWRPVLIDEVDARKIVWPQQYTRERGDITEITPRIQIDWSPTNAMPTEPGKFLCHSYKARRGRPGKGCLIRAVAWLWMFKRFSIVDLASLLEQWGRPWPVIKYDSKSTAEEVATWLATLADSMADRQMAIPMGSELEVKPAGAAGAETPHLEMVKLCNEGQSKVVIGATTIAEAAGDSKNVSSPTHADVRTDIRNADARAIAVSIRESLIRPFVVWNFGAGCPVPKFAPNLAPKPDPSSRADVYVKASTLRMRVKSEQLYRELSIEKPEDVEDVVVLGETGDRRQETGDLVAAIESPDMEFKREVLRAFLADRTVNDALFNLTDVRTLVEQLGIPIDPKYVEPWMPVRDDTGALISGGVVEDEDGDVVGGAVIPGSGPASPVGVAGQDAETRRRGDAETVKAAPVSSTQEAEVLPELVLNGAQIQAAVAIVTAVAAGELPRDAGIGQLSVLFNLKPEQAEAIMGSAGTSKPTTPNPRPAAEEDAEARRRGDAERFEIRDLRFES